MNRRLFFAFLLAAFALVSIITLKVKPLQAEDVLEVMLPGGYRIEPVASGLTFPTSIAWDESGRMYVTEAGYAYGPKEVGPGRIVRIENGTPTIVADGLNSPATDVKFRDGEMYAAHRGTLSVFRNGSRTDLITDLPSGDHFTGEIAFDDEGWVYVGNGTVTNSGVVADDNFRFGWASENPELHDVPGKDITLTGENFTSLDLRTPNPSDTTSTGGFTAFGTTSSPGQVVEGSLKSNGVILRVKADGADSQVYAWGLRNPFAMGFDKAGRLIAIDQGYDDRGVRPVANAPDPVYEIKEGAWYGWPDYVAGIPITDPQFRSANGVPSPSFLMSEHPPVEQPLAKLEAHTAAMKFDFAPPGFDNRERMFIAAFGSGDPATGIVGKVTGSKVVALDLNTGEVEDFAYNKARKPAGRNISGLNHPIDAKFGPDGSLYVVDFGVFEVNGQVPNAVPKTGMVWRIYKQRSEYAEFIAETMKKLEAAPPWDPDYAPLTAQVQQWVDSQPAEWGVYFKDLKSGKTFGVNERAAIPAASTVKVAVVLYTSHLVSQGKLSWDERLTYYADRDWRSGAGTMQYTAKDGEQFTVRELAEKAIRDSDNVAWKMLERRLGKENLINFMWELGGENVYPGGQNISTPKDNAVYMEAALSFAKESPEGGKLIFDLANTVWNTGINRYIDEVTVAHKEGDITGVADDVGIVYATHPYIISVMSQGHDDVEAGFELIGQLSRMIFDYQMGLEP
ncbi:MAG: serine hydrolase [Bacillota bacterium]